MKLTQLQEAGYAGLPKTVVVVKFVGEGDTGSDVIGPFNSKEDAARYIEHLKKEAPQEMQYYFGAGEVIVDETISPQEWLKRCVRYEQEDYS